MRVPGVVNKLWRYISKIVVYPVNTLGMPPNKIIPAIPDVLIGIDECGMIDRKGRPRILGREAQPADLERAACKSTT